MPVYFENLIPNAFLKRIIKSRVTQAIAQGYEGFAELRTTPSHETGETAFQVRNNVNLIVTDTRKDSQFDFHWFKVYNRGNEAEAGWLDSRTAWYSYSELEAEISLSTTGSPTLLSNSIEGGGSHEYTFAANKLSIIEIHVCPGLPAPILTGPNGITLTPFGDYTEWVGNAPFSGSYRLSIDSNFKGIFYAFSIRSTFFDSGKS
jgi:hypothetical protein